jgi:hypothetical protein
MTRSGRFSREGWRKLQGAFIDRGIVSCLLVFISGSAQADAVPFFATRDVPDYSASMVESDFDREGETLHSTVVHHGGWTRIERSRPGSISICLGNFFANVKMCASGEGDFERLDASDVAPAYDYDAITGSRKTEDTDIQAGERCTWWEVIRKTSSTWHGPSWLSCLTDDGIEVGTKVLDYDNKPERETRLLTLVRRPVAEAEVNPPARLFDPGFWLKPRREYPDKPAAAADFEVTMSGNNSQKRVLRHYPWRFEEIRDDNGSIRLTVWNELENQGMFIRISTVQHQLYALRSPLDPKHPHSFFDQRTGQVDLKRYDEILGERCTWFDLMPNVADVGNEQCLTADGVPLRDVRTSGWGYGANHTAVSVRRRPVDLKEMFPAPELLDPTTWGFPAAN